MNGLHGIDVGLVVAGALVLAVGLVRWLRAGRRDPLRGAPYRRNRLSLLLLWGCLLAYMLAGLAGLALASWWVPAQASDPLIEAWRGMLANSLVQVVSIAAALVVAYLAFAEGWRGFGFRGDRLGRQLAMAAGGFVVALYLISLVNWYTDWLISVLWPEYELPAHGVFMTLMSPDAPHLLRVLSLLGAAVLAPVGEELLYRGILQTALARLGVFGLGPICRLIRVGRPGRRRWMGHRWLAIGVAGLIFGLMHWMTPQFIPALVVFGVLLGYLYERTGSLWVPMLVHALFNIKSLAWFFLQTPSAG